MKDADGEASGIRDMLNWIEDSTKVNFLEHVLSDTCSLCLDCDIYQIYKVILNMDAVVLFLPELLHILNSSNYNLIDLTVETSV